MLTFKEFLEEKYSFKNTGNSNYLTLDDGEILHYTLKTLDKGYIELVYKTKMYKITVSHNMLKDIEDITGSPVNMNDEDTKKFLSYLPCDGQ